MGGIDGARAPAPPREDEPGRMAPGGESAAMDSSTPGARPTADEVQRFRADLASIGRETLRLLVEGPPDADRRVAELDARADAIRAALRTASIAPDDSKVDWLAADARMAERALGDKGSGGASGG